MNSYRVDAGTCELKDSTSLPSIDGDVHPGETPSGLSLSLVARRVIVVYHFTFSTPCDVFFIHQDRESSK